MRDGLDAQGRRDQRDEGDERETGQGVGDTGAD